MKKISLIFTLFCLISVYSGFSQNCNADYTWTIKNDTNYPYSFNAIFYNSTFGLWQNTGMLQVAGNSETNVPVSGNYFLWNLRVYACSNGCNILLDANVNLISPTSQYVGDCDNLIGPCENRVDVWNCSAASISEYY